VKRFPIAVAGLSLAASALGCSDRTFAPAPAEEQSPIVNSHLSKPADNAVVGILATGRGCTGTLIAPNVVLTALHCITEDFDAGVPFRCKSDGTLQPGSSGGWLGPLVDPPSAVSVQVGVQLGGTRIKAKALFGTGSDTACKDDLGVIVLESAPDIGGASLVSLRFNPTTDGELTRAVGYGSTYGTSTVNGRQERNDLQILAMGNSDVSGEGDVGFIARTIMVGEGPCQGDSGGPIFSEETGAQVGVYSLILSSTCVGIDVQNIYTEVAPFESLIREVLATAGEEPLVEPPPATGTGGGAGATGEGGEPGNAGASSDAGAEGGAPPGTGGTVGTGGTTSKGGSGGSGAVGGTSTSGTGGTDATGGDAPMNPTNQGKGSGSRDDGSCAIKPGIAPNAGARSLALFALLALSIVRRRRGR
jgi:hypothetical protein